VQVRRVDDVEIDEPDPADARRGEVEPERRAEPAGTDQEDARLLQSPLPLRPDLVHDQMPRIAEPLLRRELECTRPRPKHRQPPSWRQRPRQPPRSPRKVALPGARRNRTVSASYRYCPDSMTRRAAEPRAPASDAGPPALHALAVRPNHTPSCRRLSIRR